MFDASPTLLLVTSDTKESPSRREFANRANAQLSTGPRTEVGKRKVAANALTHGLTAKRMVLPLEDQAAFDDLVHQMWVTLDPVGALEAALAERIVGCFWRLRRCATIEHQILSWACEGPARRRVDVPADQVLGWSYVANNDGGLERVGRHEDRIERSLHKSLAALQRLQAERRGAAPAPVPAIDVEINIDVTAEPNGRSG
ncbi:MAG: hypothetical protein NT062_10945, partial [Proteobacteria bacterium]|nr:hypothetical protein [Pseudomonadota bacterium]